MVIKLSIPSDAHLLIEPGQHISIGDPLVEESTSEDITISVSKQLGIKPQEIFQYSTVIVGDAITPGDVIAQKKGVFGTKKFKSSQGGTIKHIDHTSGSITLSMKSSSTHHITSCVDGEVKDINIEQGILSVEIGSADSMPATGSGDCGGRRVVLTQKDFFSCDEDDIKGGCIITHSTLVHVTSKMEALGARCILSVEGPESDLPSLHCDEETFEKISQSSHSHVVYSVHEGLVYLYSPKT